MVALAKAKRPAGVWQPGDRVWDESAQAFDSAAVRALLQSGEVLAEEERWRPTRWLMKAVWEVVHGSPSPLASLVSGPRSPSDNHNYILDLYRKLTGDFVSQAEEVSGAGERAHTRCSRSYVFSANLRDWLHEIPAFVDVPSGWQPPPSALQYTAAAPAAQPASIGAARRPKMGAAQDAPPSTPMLGGGFRLLGEEESARGDGDQYSHPPSSCAPAAPPPSCAPPRSSHFAPDAPPSVAAARTSPARRQAPQRSRPVQRERPPATVPSARVAPRRGSPRRGAGSHNDGRGLQLIAELAARLRGRMHDDLLRPADLFRRWDSDSDGVVTLDELLQVSCCPHPFKPAIPPP